MSKKPFKVGDKIRALGGFTPNSTNKFGAWMSCHPDFLYVVDAVEFSSDNNLLIRCIGSKDPEDLRLGCVGMTGWIDSRQVVARIKPKAPKKAA